jgi:hypothetical protein
MYFLFHYLERKSAVDGGGCYSSTVMAAVGHEVMQVMQRMQSSALTGTDFFESGYSGKS